MGKVLIAFVAGLAVAALAFNLFDKGPARPSLERSNDMPSRRSVETSDPGSEGGSRNVVLNENATDSGSTELEVPGTSSTNELPPPELPIFLPAEFD